MQQIQDTQLLLGQLPDTLRRELIGAYDSVTKNFRENRWEPSELNGGKFSEVVYCVLKGYLECDYPSRAKKPQNFNVACGQLAQIVTQISYGQESVRLTIPRVLIALYDIRNHRSVGHTGGDIDPNHMDASLVLAMTKWVMAELIRVLHQTDIVSATQAVEVLSERTIPCVWEVDGGKHILDEKMGKQDQILHLLYSTIRPVTDRELAAWAETRIDNLQRTLRLMHRKKLVHFSHKNGVVTLSPLGSDVVEKSLS